MLSAEDLAAVRIAIELCNYPELKKEILCARGSDARRCLMRYDCDLKEQWKKIVENQATIMLKNLGLIKELWGKVIGLQLLIGMRMAMWAEYHERFLGLHREFSFKFFKSSFFTSQGIIDNKKLAEELMKNKSLSIKQKYKLACLYCLKEDIPDLYRQMSQEDKEEFYADQKPQRIKQPEIVKFWTYYLVGQIDHLRGEKTLEDYMLEKAVKSGSKAAVEYCLEKTSLSRKEDAVIDAALETVRSWTKISFQDDCDIFEMNDRSYHMEFWIPSDFFVDILYFLLSKMREDQKIEFLKKDIEGLDYEISYYENHERSRVLECLLNWPYQNYFMQTAQLMWEFLPEWSYAELLLKICLRMIPFKMDLKDGEEKSFDYKGLLREFWCQSPDHYKRYVFSDKKVTYWSGMKDILMEGKDLLHRLFTLRNFTYEDGKNIEMILDSATDEEKETIILSKKGKDICIDLMTEERWQILDGFVSKCIYSKEKAKEFKRRFSFTEEAMDTCINFIEKDKWDAAELFIKWGSLTEEEIIRLKREMIPNQDRRHEYAALNLHNDVEIAKKFCEWGLSSKEDIRRFKKELIFSVGVESCADLITKDKLDVADEFVNWSLFSPEEIAEFKTYLCWKKGNSICEHLISHEVANLVFDYAMFVLTIEFQGAKWDQVEKYLTWCFSSEEEINDFKKDRLLKESGKKIHFNFIKYNHWADAETFFAWLGLSPEEVKELKKETLFNHEEANHMFSELMYCTEYDGRFERSGFSDYGSRQEGIELLLRWYLTDEGSVLEFRDHFKQKCVDQELSEEDRDVLEDFDLAIEQRLRDLEEEQTGSLN